MADLYPVLEIESESAGNFEFSASGVHSETRTYVPKIKEWSAVNLEVNERSNDTAALEVDIVIIDTPDQYQSGLRVFDGLATGFANRLRGAQATLYLLSPNMARDDALIVFRGVLDSFIKTGLVEWTIRLRTDDKALSYSEAPRIPYERYFPRLDPDAEGSFAALIYGEHSGIAAGGKGGAVKLTYVDTGVDVTTGPFLYSPGLGEVTITAVYRPDDTGTATPGEVSEAAQTDNYTTVDPAEYQISTITRGGKSFTVVSFALNQNDGAERNVELRADVQGFGSVEEDGFIGDWQNPAWQLLHFLANFVFGDWRSGEYVDPVTLPLDLGSFAFTADYFDIFGYESSRLLREPTPCETTVNDWASNVSCKVFWTNEGKLAISPIDLRPPLDLYDAEQHARASEEAFSFELPTDSSQTVERITYSELYLDAEGRFMKTRSVSDISVPEKVRRTASLNWSKSAL
jgi:hypothetical protein